MFQLMYYEHNNYFKHVKLTKLFLFLQVSDMRIYKKGYA